MGIETRRSTDIVAVADPLLGQALKLVRDRACDGLRVDDLLKEVPFRGVRWNEAFENSSAVPEYGDTSS